MEICIKWNVCRICLAEEESNEKSNMHNIFNTDSKIAEQIYGCSGIEIKQSDNFPEKICRKCLFMLKHALKFRTTCKNSTDYLQSIVQQTKSASSLFKNDKCSEKVDGYNFDMTVDFLDEMEYDGIEIFEEKETTKELVPNKCAELVKEDAIPTNENEESNLSQNDDDEQKRERRTDENIVEPHELPSNADKTNNYEASDTQTETNNEESVYSDVLFIMEDEIKQEFTIVEENEVDFATEHVQSNQMPLDSDAPVEEYIAMDIISSTYDGDKEDLKPIRKYTSKVDKVKAKYYICDICGNNFHQKASLNFHIKIHKNERRYKCEFCEKRFNSTCNLTAHMRVHTGEKPFECPFCQRRFSDRSTQRKHERIHTNEKPYACGSCRKTFSLSTSLRAHEKIHSGEKPHKCETCSRSFTLPHQLKAHLSTHLHRILTQEQDQ